MKKTITLLVCIFFCCLLSAQKKPIYLFPEFEQGRVLLRNGAIVNTSMNYDAANSRMMYKDKETTMELTGINDIDTIYIANRKFIPVATIFCETKQLLHGTLYIQWILKDLVIGKKGAYGQVVQGTVRTINTNNFTFNPEYKNESTDVTQVNNNNIYYFKKEGKYVKFKDRKSLLKLFPDKKNELSDFINKNNINFYNTESVIQLANYCIGLN